MLKWDWVGLGVYLGWFVCLSVWCGCLGSPLLFGRGAPLSRCFGSLRSGSLFLPAVSSWASGFLPAGRPRGFRVGSFLASGFGVSFCGVFLCFLSLLFLPSLLLVLLLSFLLLLFVLRCRCPRCFVCLGVALLSSSVSVGRRPLLPSLSGWWGRLLLLFVVLALRLLLLCLLWSLSFAVLFGLVSPAALVFVVLGVAGGSVPLRLSKLASSARLPLGGWVVVDCFLLSSLRQGLAFNALERSL